MLPCSGRTGVWVVALFDYLLKHLFLVFLGQNVATLISILSDSKLLEELIPCLLLLLFCLVWVNEVRDGDVSGILWTCDTHLLVRLVFCLELSLRISSESLVKMLVLVDVSRPWEVVGEDLALWAQLEASRHDHEENDFHFNV